MKISNRVKRNISFTLLLVGIACIIDRIWQVVITPDSGKAWFNLFGILVLTYLCFDSFKELRKRVRDGIVYGSNAK